MEVTALCFVKRGLMARDAGLPLDKIRTSDRERRTHKASPNDLSPPNLHDAFKSPFNIVYYST